MTSSRTVRFAGLLALLALLAAGPTTSVSAQYTVGLAADYLGYSFDEGLGADAAQLLIVPIGVRVPVTDALTFDVSGAWAKGTVETDGTRLDITGLVDTGVRVAYQATPWGLLTVGVNVPTGDPQHDSEEAVVASILSMDLLGFRETTWGRGLAFTSSVAVARSVGSFGLGFAAAYALRGEFKPSAEQDDLQYQPGNEARIRLGMDRNFGNSTLTFGATFITYSDDQADGTNLFKAGNRLNFDLTYAWRMAAGVWTVYAADLVRQGGDRFAEIQDSLGTSQGVATFETPAQNLALLGVMGAVGVGGGFVFRPHVDLKLQTVDDPGGSETGSGWMVAAGGDIPVRIFGGTDFFPKARVLFGSIKDAGGAGVGVLGVEIIGTVRTAF